MKPKRIISMAISEISLDFIEVEHSKKSHNLISYGSYDLNLDDLDQFEEIVSTISQTTKSPHYTGISIIHRDTLRTTLVLNKTNDIKTAILQNIKKAYEISLSDYYIDFVTEELENNQLLVFVVAVPKKIFDPLFKILKKHHFKLLFMEIGSLSVLRSIEKQFNYDFFLYIHFDYHISSISIAKNGIIYAIRYINLGFEDMIDSLIKSGGISPEEAESLFFKYGAKKIDSDDEELKVIHDNMMESLDKLSMEIQRTIDFFSITYKQPSPKNFIISGLIEKIPEFDEYISNLFSVNVEKESAVKLLTISNDITPDFSSMRYLFVCIGAALR